MNDFFNAAKHGLQNLIQFSGCDNRKQFWFYAGTVIATVFVGFQVFFIVIFSESFFTAKSQAQFVAGIDRLMLATGILALVLILLLAAAIARRLRDASVPSLFGLAPLPFLGIGFMVMPILFKSALYSDDFDLRLFFLVFANNVAYLGSLGFLVFFLSKPSAQN